MAKARAAGDVGNAKANSKTSLIAIVAIVALVLVGLCAWMLYGQNAAGAANGAVAKVHDSQGNVTTISLSEDSSQTITTDLGSNTLVVENGEVYVSDADCSNHDCVRQGKIGAAGQQIICLPHKLWVEVVAEGGESAGAPSELSGASAGDDAGSSADGEVFDAESR